jgi:hypothetical protein
LYGVGPKEYLREHVGKQKEGMGRFSIQTSGHDFERQSKQVRQASEIHKERSCKTNFNGAPIWCPIFILGLQPLKNAENPYPTEDQNR